MFSSIKYVDKTDSCIFSSIAGNRPVLFLGLSQVYDFLFLLKIFFRLGNFFLRCIPYSKAPFTAHPAVTLGNMYCMFFDSLERTQIMKFFLVFGFVYCLLPVMGAFQLFCCWVEFRFPLDFL